MQAMQISIGQPNPFADKLTGLVHLLPLPTFLFLGGCLLLLAGVGSKVWRGAFRYDFVDTVDLRDLEKHHPYLPSARAIILVGMATSLLLMLGLVLLGGVTLFSGPYWWLYIGAFFILTAVVSVLGELQWPLAMEFSLAFSVGTTTAFLLFVFETVILSVGGVLPWVFGTIVSILALVETAFIWRLLSRAPRLFLILSFLLWIIVRYFT